MTMNQDRKLQRTEERRQFLTASDWRGLPLSPMRGGGSPREFFRLTKPSGQSAVLIDADGVMPPPTGPLVDFVKTAEHLRGLGLSAPEIYEFDEAGGFLIHEDFGSQTLGQMLTNDDTHVFDAYECAVRAIAVMREASGAGSLVDMPQHDEEFSLSQVKWFADWYYPALTRHEMPPDVLAEFEAVWRDAYRQMPQGLKRASLHFDYNNTNLFYLPEREGAKACGMIDFQDGVFSGPSAYDYISLINEPRRDLPQGWQEKLEATWLDGVAESDVESHKLWAKFLNAERHIRVMGNFALLFVRDHKPEYLDYLPLVARFVDEGLDHEVFTDVRKWINKHTPNYRQPLAPEDVRTFLKTG